MCEDAAPGKRPRLVSVSSNRRCFNWNLKCLLLFLYYWHGDNQMRPKKQNLVFVSSVKVHKTDHICVILNMWKMQIVPFSTWVLYKTQSIFRTGGPFIPDNHTRNVLFPFFQFVLAIMTKAGKLCGDCRRNLTVVLHKLKF